ncbi:mechanosensitive ion channel family protein [halophilic archaeon]|nr:mechanosensitive ion channel family protein [halophilic archaeon]
MVTPLPFLDRILETEYAIAVTQSLYFVGSFAALYLVGRLAVLPVVRRVLDSRDYDQSVTKPLAKLAHFGVLFAAVALAFGFADYGNILSALATVAAAATLAVGFALQDIIANFVAGVFIFTDKPFKIGDWIEWDDGKYKGVVEDISLRVTRVRTFDNERLTVPNSVLTDGVIKNPVANDRLRVTFDFGIGYDDDVERATEVIVDEAREHPDVLDDPEPSVRLTELGDSAVGLRSRFWIADPARSDFVRTRAEYVSAVKRRFDDEGIDIPYPHRTLAGGIEVTDAANLAEVSGD